MSTPESVPTIFMDIEKLLENIQKPGRYIGNEWNVSRKDFDSVKVKIALCFPDAYEIGMSHLGFKILYHLLNEQPGVVCERVFMPWIDFQAALQREGALLFSLESKRPLAEFDIIGFSLEHELSYTNVLAVLSLAGIPLKSSERSDKFPLIIGGGVCVVNPEPMADFFDAFFIGEAEEGILEIMRVIARSKAEGRATKQSPRADVLKDLAAIEGMYVPSLYSAKTVIKKRIVKDFGNAYYPVKQIVPYIQIVHDRIALEIMRGCPNNCNFCQATSVYRPLRIRSVDRILQLAEEAYQATGYDEISLVSLSTGDYPHIAELVKALTDRFQSRKVSISLPSLRAEDMLVNLPQLISSIKKTGLTFAPEAGSQRLRDAINKRLDIEKLYECTQAAAKNGWRSVKLYFMIGLPGETEEDLAQIKGLIRKIPMQATASFSYFVPKPHTKFQNETMDSMDSLLKKKAFLEKDLKMKGVTLRWHDIRMSMVEAALSRGDRRLSEVILKAFTLGARFDSWSEHFNYSIWQEAGIESVSRTEPLPWAHIDCGLL